MSRYPPGVFVTKVKLMAESKARTERQNRTISRIHRIQGQLSALERAIEEGKDCEYRVTQALAIEKAVSSLTLHMLGGYIEHQARGQIHSDPDATLDEIKRLFKLMMK